MRKYLKKLVAMLIVMGMMLCNNTAIFATNVQDPEDPLNERASGYVDEGFYDEIQMNARYSMSRMSAYDQGLVHNSKFDNTTHKIGIDVSSHNGTIDWNAVKASGIQFAFVRLSYRAYVSGTLAADINGLKNLQEARSVGLDVGVYIFSQAINTAEAIEEADYICNQLVGYSITLPVVMDYEYVSGNTGRLYNANLSKQQATDNVIAFCNRVRERGYSAMLYANKSFLNNSVDASAISSAYQVWLANYTNSTNYGGDYTFWQYTSTGNINGVSGNVDCDIWYDPGMSACLNYTTHVQDYGWQGAVTDGTIAGTSGQSKRLEAIQISEIANPNLGVEYRTHIQDYGWETQWRTDGQVSGTSGQSKRLEAIQIRLTGSDANKYDIFYSTHIQNYGWLNWAKNGEISGSSGFAYRMEAIIVVILPKGSPAPAKLGNLGIGYITNAITYNTHVQDYGWQNYVGGSGISGTSGQSKRLEGIHIALQDTGYQGGIEYRTHIQDYGWENDWRSNNQLSGTTGESKRLEAIQIRLTGDISNYYDVYYRVHCQNFGWMGWARNGESAGSAGYAYRLEAIQIMLVPKGFQAPGSTANCFVQR